MSNKKEREKLCVGLLMFMAVLKLLKILEFNNKEEIYLYYIHEQYIHYTYIMNFGAGYEKKS